MSDKTTRCTACAAEFTDADLEGHSACPTCGNPGVPCAISEDVTVRINWHELRILGIWASNYAGGKAFDDERGRHSRRTRQAILARLEAQHPGKAALTMAGEMKSLANALGTTVEMRTGSKVETFKGEKPS